MGFPIALITDDFTNNTIEPAWTTSTSGSATAAETSGQARLTLPSSIAGTHDAYYISSAAYDLTADAFVWNIETMVATGVAASAFLDLIATIGTGNTLRWRQLSNAITARSFVAGVETQHYTATWSSSTYKYLRIRESGGTIFWDSSTNGTSWTNRASLAAPFAVTDLTIRFGVSCGNIASPGSLRLDDVNLILPAPSSTWRETNGDWSDTYRIRSITLASDGGKQGVIVTADAMDETTRALSGNVRYFAGPLGSSSGGYLQLTEYASLVLAQGSPFPVPVDGRVDLPAVVTTRHCRIYHRSIDAVSHSIYEYVPRRLVQADDIEAESIRAINIGAGAVIADKIFVLNLEAVNADMGNLHMDGVIDIESTGGIYQGTGTFASPTTGLKLFNSSGVGKLSTYNTGAEQITLDTDGKLKAGAGTIQLDSDGMKIIVPTDDNYLDNASLKFQSSGGTVYADIYALDYSSSPFENQLVLQSNAIASQPSGVYTLAVAPTTYPATVQLAANSGGFSTTLFKIIADDNARNYASLSRDLDIALGLNVGSATGATTGEIRASDKLRLNSVTAQSMQMRAISIVNNANDKLPHNATESGIVLILDSSGASAIFALTGGGHTTAEMSDPSGVFSGTSGTGSSSNVYWSAGNSRYEIENKRGVTVDYRVFLFV